MIVLSDCIVVISIVYGLKFIYSKVVYYEKRFEGFESRYVNSSVVVKDDFSVVMDVFSICLNK